MDSGNIAGMNVAGSMWRVPVPVYNKSAAIQFNTTDSFRHSAGEEKTDVNTMKAAGQLFIKKKAPPSFFLWEYDMGKENYNVVMSAGKDGAVYLAGITGDIAAMDGKTGKKLWDFDLKDNPAAAPVEGKNGMVYCASGKGGIIALDKKTGESKWTFESGSILPDKKPLIGDDGTVYFGNAKGNVFALNGDTGEKKWTFKTDGEINCTPAIDDRGVLFVSDKAGKLYAIDGKTGKMKWNKDVKVDDFNDPLPGADNTVVVGTSEKKLCGLDRETGEVKWDYETKLFTTHPMYSSAGVIIENDYKGPMSAIEPGTGKELWQIPDPNYDELFPLIGEDGLIYISQKFTDCTVKLRAINPLDGQTILHQDVVKDGEWKPALAWGRKIIAGTNESKVQVFALNEMEGKESDVLHEKRQELFQEYKKEMEEKAAESTTEAGTIKVEKGQVNIGGVSLPIRGESGK